MKRRKSRNGEEKSKKRRITGSEITQFIRSKCLEDCVINSVSSLAGGGLILSRETGDGDVLLEAELHNNGDFVVEEWIPDNDPEFGGRFELIERGNIFDRTMETEKMGTLNLRGQFVFESYFSLDTGESADGAGFRIDDEETVAEVYEETLEAYATQIKRSRCSVTDHGVHRRTDGDVMYIEWQDEDGLDHEEEIAIYAEYDGRMVLIPVSDDPVEEAGYRR